MTKKEWVQQRTAKGVCVDCSNPAKQGCRRCQACLSRNRDWSKRNRDRVNGYTSKKAWYAKFKKEKTCYKCGSPQVGNSNYCYECYMKTISLTLTINGKRTNKNWRLLEDLFKSQRGICPYTGRFLSIGMDAELDHITPRCLGGSDNLENLQWVYNGINRMKGGMMESDFLSLVRETYETRLKGTMLKIPNTSSGLPSLPE